MADFSFYLEVLIAEQFACSWLSSRENSLIEFSKFALALVDDLEKILSQTARRGSLERATAAVAPGRVVAFRGD